MNSIDVFVNEIGVLFKATFSKNAIEWPPVSQISKIVWVYYFPSSPQQDGNIGSMHQTLAACLFGQLDWIDYICFSCKVISANHRK